MSKKLFTKSAFKVALECPWKLYYYRNPEKYDNENQNDEFLASLAEGGFQVGELAKYYCGVDGDADLKDLTGYDEPLKRTAELMQRENVTIAEAAFQYGDLFVRVDILKKHGDEIELIEVKAKSWNPEKDSFLSTRPQGAVASDIRSYVYDVAFQKYVVTQALPGCNIKAYLMMADKSKCADIDGINQMFKIKKDAKGHTEATMVDGAKAALVGSKEHLLTPFDVDSICDDIIAGNTTEQQTSQKIPYMHGLCFKEFVKRTSESYCKNVPYPGKPVLCGKCIKCEFDADIEDHKDRSGKFECWKQYVTAEDFELRPMVESLNGSGLSRNRDEWIRNGKYFLDQLTSEDLQEYDEKKVGEPGLDNNQRKWLQIGLMLSDNNILSRFDKNLVDATTYLDKEGLRAEMATWKYPLHMIDFETTAVALPYYKGMKPYEQVAFQFSHHIINEDGTIEHAGQYLNKDVSKFPNFEFVRELKRQLEKDNGSVFRYANHENTILCIIAEQLAQSNEPDKEELIAFIHTLTHSKSYKGNRDMIDLLEIVKSYFYELREMQGSNSIKQVLPAVLNSSMYIKEKYSTPIYGKEIKSLNIKETEPIAWVKRDHHGVIESPYHLLPSLAEVLGVSTEELSKMEDADDYDFTVANGGEALTAYSKLMFCDNTDMGALKYAGLREALLRYCELDTMSMVFIWEYFNHECNQKD